jgi:hypothetical protein
MPLSPAEVEMVKTLFELCPVRLLQRGHPPGPVLPPGACRLEEAGGRLLVDAGGGEGSLEVLSVDLARQESCRLIGPGGLAEAEFLPDRQACPPGDLGLSQQRRFYDLRLGTLLRRRLPAGCRLEQAGSGRDSRQRFSGRFCRLVLRLRSSYLAGMALYPFQGAEAVAEFLSAALVWLEHCRNTRRRFGSDLPLLFPGDTYLHALGRLELLDGHRVRPRLLGYDLEAGVLEELDPADLRRRRALPVSFEFAAERPLHDNPLARRLRDRFPADLDHEKTPHSFDWLSCRGLPLVQIHGPREEDLRLGWAAPLAPWPDWGWDRAVAWLEEARRLRSEPPPQPLHEVYRRCPERWMEHLLLQDLCRLDPRLQPEWTYRQVPAYRGTGRAIMDVLSVEPDGRLVVVELKAGEEGSLLFQALDYWERVWDGLRSGAFQNSGYFAGVRLRPDPPALILVTPLFRCHRHQTLLASYLKPGIPVTLVEWNLRWRGGWRPVRRTPLTPPR